MSSQDVVGTMRPLLEQNGNTLVVDMAPEVGEMHADVTKVRQILVNLLSNAAKFTERGTVTVHVARESVAGRDYLTFRIRDTGIGMTPVQMARLFRPFVQADNSVTRKYGGTGLGLAICTEFAALMGGTIDVDSELGAGVDVHRATARHRLVQRHAECKRPSRSWSMAVPW